MTSFEALFLIGRVLFSALFILSGLNHFTQMDGMRQYAASKGVPAPGAMVALTGLVLLAGGLSVLLWIWVEVGTWLLAFFLLLAAFKIHDFWALDDPNERQTEMAHFMKNLSLAGAAIAFYALVQMPGPGA